MSMILFFDDEPHKTKYLVQNLVENYGWTGDREIIYVSQVEDLLNKINNSTANPYNLLVLDIMVPLDPSVEKLFSKEEVERLNDGLNTGLIIAKKIRSMDKYTKVPILFLSARNIPPIPENEKEYTDYLSKPESAAVISERMEQLLNRKNKPSL